MGRQAWGGAGGGGGRGRGGTHGLEQRLGVLHGGARHQLHAGNGLEVRLQALRVLGAQLLAHPTGTTHNNGHLAGTRARKKAGGGGGGAWAGLRMSPFS